jgi:hypothetical protein
MAADAIPFAPSGPRVYIVAEDAATGALLGSLFVPVGGRLATEYVHDSLLTFVVVAGKMLVRMRLDACGGATARFGISAGGAWEVPCRTLLGMVNPLPAPAQLLFWRRKAAAAAAATATATATAATAAAETPAANEAAAAASGVGDGAGAKCRVWEGNGRAEMRRRAGRL